MLRKFQPPVAAKPAATPSPKVPTPVPSASSALVRKPVQRRQKASIPMTGGRADLPSCERRPAWVKWYISEKHGLQCMKMPGFLTSTQPTGYVAEGSAEEAEIKAALESDR